MPVVGVTVGMVVITVVDVAGIEVTFFPGVIVDVDSDNLWVTRC